MAPFLQDIVENPEVAMHAFWTGSISFGLVNIPIQVFSAAEEREVRLHYLHKKDLSPVRFAKICKKEETEIAYSELVRGYEYRKGQFVVITDQELKNASPEKTKFIDIVHFVEECDIDIIYGAHPYYLKPDKKAGKAYGLLKEALKKSRKVAVARFVFHTKEYVGIIKPFRNVLILNQLRFDEEIRDPGALEIPASPKTTKKELDMALALVQQLTHPFEAADYKDTYSHQLLTVIKRKAKGKPASSSAPKREKAKVYNLMEALKKSLKAA